MQPDLALNTVISNAGSRQPVHVKHTWSVILLILSAEILNVEQEAQQLLKDQGLVLDEATGADTLDWFYDVIEQDRIESVLVPVFTDVRWPKLKQAGFVVEIDDSFGLSIEEAGEWHAHVEVEAGDQWFNLKLGVDIDGDKQAAESAARAAGSPAAVQSPGTAARGTDAVA